jgi:uncharacterized protein (DUF736 family)
MKAADLKHNKFIAEKGIKVKELPIEIQTVIQTLNTTINIRLIAIKDEDKKKLVINEYIKTSETIADFLQIWLDNPEIRDMDISEIFADEEIENEVKVEVKEQVEEIKEQVIESNQVIATIEKENNEQKPPVVEVAEPIKKEVTNTETGNKKRDVLHTLFTQGKTVVTADDLKSLGYPMGFFDDIYSGTGDYILKKRNAFSAQYVIAKR